STGLPFDDVVLPRRQLDTGRERTDVVVVFGEPRDDRAVYPDREALPLAQRVGVRELALLKANELVRREAVAPRDRADRVARLHLVCDPLAHARGDVRADAQLLPDAELVRIVAQPRVEADQIVSTHAVATGDLPEVLAGHHLVDVERGLVVAERMVAVALPLDADAELLTHAQAIGVLAQPRVVLRHRGLRDAVLLGDASERLARPDLVHEDPPGATTPRPAATRRRRRGGGRTRARRGFLRRLGRADVDLL